MWNVLYSNTSVNKRDKFHEHISHVERVTSAKPAFKIIEPKQFPFLEMRQKKFQIEKGEIKECKLN